MGGDAYMQEYEYNKKRKSGRFGWLLLKIIVYLVILYVIIFVASKPVSMMLGYGTTLINDRKVSDTLGEQTIVYAEASKFSSSMMNDIVSYLGNTDGSLVILNIEAVEGKEIEHLIKAVDKSSNIDNTKYVLFTSSDIDSFDDVTVGVSDVSIDLNGKAVKLIKVSSDDLNSLNAITDNSVGFEIAICADKSALGKCDAKGIEIGICRDTDTKLNGNMLMIGSSQLFKDKYIVEEIVFSNTTEGDSKRPLAKVVEIDRTKDGTGKYYYDDDGKEVYVPNIKTTTEAEDAGFN